MLSNLEQVYAGRNGSLYKTISLVTTDAGVHKFHKNLEATTEF